MNSVDTLVPRITLTTDFGTEDGYVGAMKGQLLQAIPGLQIIDISHEIPAQDILRAGFCLKRILPHYPNNTVHLLVVDPEVGSLRKALLIHLKNQWILCPENHLVAPFLESEKEYRVYRLHEQTSWWKKHASFDGLHLFTPAAICLLRGEPIDSLAEEVVDYQPPKLSKPELANEKVIGEILTFDHFGNAITNIDESLCKKQKLIVFEYDHLRFTLKNNYSSVEPGHLVAIINSDGLVELSMSQGNAKQHFKLEAGEPVTGI